MEQKRRLGRRSVLVVILGVVVLGVVLTVGWFTIGSCLTGHGCPYDSTYLPALDADPMASYQPPGTALAKEDRQAESSDWLTGGAAYVERVFAILDQEEAELVVAQTVAWAESRGWVFNDQGGGCKQLQPGTAEISVTLEDDYATSDPGDLRLQILMRFSTDVPSCGPPSDASEESNTSA